MQGVSGLISLGSPRVFISNGGPHSAEAWTDMALGKLIAVSEGAPEPLRQQAEAFKGQLRSVLLFYIRAAQEDVKAHLLKERML